MCWGWGCALVEHLPSILEALGSYSSLDKAGMAVDVSNYDTGVVEAVGSQVQGHHQLHSGFEASLGYMRAQKFF